MHAILKCYYHCSHYFLEKKQNIFNKLSKNIQWLISTLKKMSYFSQFSYTIFLNRTAKLNCSISASSSHSFHYLHYHYICNCPSLVSLLCSYFVCFLRISLSPPPYTDVQLQLLLLLWVDNKDYEYHHNSHSSIWEFHSVL